MTKFLLVFRIDHMNSISLETVGEAASGTPRLLLLWRCNWEHRSLITLCSLDESLQKFITTNDSASLEQLVCFISLWALCNWMCFLLSLCWYLKNSEPFLWQMPRLYSVHFVNYSYPDFSFCLLLVSLWLVTPPPLYLIILCVFF